MEEDNAWRKSDRQDQKTGCRSILCLRLINRWLVAERPGYQHHVNNSSLQLQNRKAPNIERGDVNKRIQAKAGRNPERWILQARLYLESKCGEGQC